MEKLLFILISTLLTAVIIFFLPIGLTKKEKIVITLTASLIGIIGLVAATSLLLWQVVAVLILLATSNGYLLANRLNNPEQSKLFFEEIHIENQEFTEEIFQYEMTAAEPTEETNTIRSTIKMNDLTEDQLPMSEEDISFLENPDRFDVGLMNDEDDHIKPFTAGNEYLSVAETETETERIYSGS
ncbi:hypothetical protein [Mesobacillus thioparans]|uniref:hypothetical protein n=1 Tax=Mesobacillus thioparans TaxID=370439 RepID=UPI0039EE8464